MKKQQSDDLQGRQGSARIGIANHFHDFFRKLDGS
jgi:hypothetical protein